MILSDRVVFLSRGLVAPTHIIRTVVDGTKLLGSVIVTIVGLYSVPTLAFAQPDHQTFVNDFARKFVDVELDKAPNKFRFDATIKFRWPGKTTEQVEAIFDQVILPKLQVAIAGAKKTARQGLQDDFTVAELQSLTGTERSEARTRVLGRFQYMLTVIIENAEVSVYKANAVAFKKLGLDMNMNEAPFK